MPKAGKFYDQDFFLWTEQQAAALRRAKGSNLPLDWENLAEEIESLGKSDRRALTSQIRRILRHLLKLEASDAAQPRLGWRATIIDARSEIAAVLRDSPSLRGEVDRLLTKQLAAAAELASADLSQHGKPADMVWRRAKSGGFTADQVLGNWSPETQH
jgi:hypothetical protein